MLNLVGVLLAIYDYISTALLRNCRSERSHPFPQSAQDTRIVCGVPKRVNWFRIAART